MTKKQGVLKKICIAKTKNITLPLGKGAEFINFIKVNLICKIYYVILPLVHKGDCFMKTKFLKLTLVFTAMISGILGLTACGEHVHAYVQSGSTPPTCTEKGFYTYTCECGDSYDEDYANALGHLFSNYLSNNDATYEADGTKTGTCSRDNCNETDTIADTGSILGKGLEYTLSDDGTYYSISKGTYSGENLIIPSTYNGLPVKKIPYEAFYGVRSLESVVIPDSVTYIGKNAFATCSYLETISIPDSIEYFGDSIFSFCNSLVYNEKDNLKYLGNETNECVYLMGVIDKTATSITIDENCIGVESGALTGCDSLEELTLPFVGGSAGSMDYSIHYTTLGYLFGVGTWYGTERYLPANLTKVTVTKATILGGYAFCELTKLTEIVLPNTLETIDNSAFLKCTGLKSITIPSSVKNIGILAFANCENLETLTIPSGVERIGNSAFYDCKKIESVVIPEGVTYIGDSAFGVCSALTSVSIPNSVEDMGANAFEYCHNLQYTVVDGYKYLGNVNNNFLYLASVEDKNITSSNINNNTKIIGSKAFYDCRYLETVSIPNGVTSIGMRAFSYCGALQSIVIPNSVKFMGGDVFECCGLLESVTLSENIKEITAGMFYCCYSLNSVVIPNGVEKIGAYAFRNSGIESIIIPDSVKEINNYAFYDCDSLVSVVIGAGVNSIYRYAFEYCDNLASVTFTDTEGWYMTNDYNAWEFKTGGTLVDLTNATTNASYFIGDYVGYLWYKI